MVDEKKVVKLPHNLILEDRRALSVSGVADIDSFDEICVNLLTDMGQLSVKGSDLHINKLSVETGELIIEGDIHSLIYSDDMPKGTSLFSRIFR